MKNFLGPKFGPKEANSVPKLGFWPFCEEKTSKWCTITVTHVSLSLRRDLQH